MAYCTITDLEARIGTTQLTKLSNDTSNAVAPDTNVITALIAQADALIDSKAGQVYTVPFAITPALVNIISINLTLYYLYSRRFGMMSVPNDWKDIFKDMNDRLEAISNMLVKLPDAATIASTEANMNVDNATDLISFTDTDNLMSDY